MRFDKSKDPGALAAKEATRYAVHGVAIVARGDETFLAATDGRALTLVRCQPDEEDSANGVYPVAAFAAARKAAPRHKADAQLSLNGSARVVSNGATTEYAKGEGAFPDVLGAVPKGKAEAVVRLDAQYLARIQKALGADGVEVRIHDVEGASLPLTIVPIYLHGGTRDGSFAVLMPISGGEGA